MKVQLKIRCGLFMEEKRNVADSPEVLLIIEPPCITEEMLEEYLATDDMLVDFFNEFLSLPTFAQPVKFNSDAGTFEVVNYAPQRLESQPKKNLHDQKPPSFIYDVLSKEKNDGQLSKMHRVSSIFSIDPNYNTVQLNQEQAIEWIKKERLPAFLESDCYFEYRLAKLISQVEWSKTGINFIIDNDYSPWIRKQIPSTPPPEEDDSSLTSLTMKKFYVSLGEATVSQVKDWFTLAKQGDSVKTTDSSMHPIVSSKIEDIQHLPGQHEKDESLPEEGPILGKASAKADVTSERSREAEEGCSVAIAAPPSHTRSRVYLAPKWHSAAKKENEQGSTTSQTAEEFLPASSRIAMKEPISELTHQPAADIEALDSKEDVRKQGPDEVSLSSESVGPDSRAAWCISHRTYDTGNRHEFERFKKFIKGTLGERQISKMKKLYLLSSGDYFLSSEVLLRLELLHGDQWNIMHLRQIQPEVLKPLLLYWGPRFCVTHSAAIDAASAKLKFWHACQERPRLDIDPFPQIVSLLPLFQKSDIPPSLLQGKTAAGSTVYRGPGIESMLQCLYLENRAGYYFTQFCENSGNKLWKNSVYFWFDLQAYHQLFYQETLQPFQIFQQAQFLYATYIAPSAIMDTGLHQNKKNMIYHKIDPAFEDVFDPAEEHILNILLEPWRKMVEADKSTYRKVELVEETQQLDSVYLRELQALHQVSISKKDESTVGATGARKEDQDLHQAPKELPGPNLSDLIHDKEKLEQFWAFLNKHSASMDLMCWLDIEEFKKTLNKDKEKSDQKSKDIKTKYLNNKYFFGPNSPATRKQQEKHVDNKSVSSSSEIAFRKALLDPVTANLFQRFVALKGDLLGNGVLFWQEVQKYKDLCHSHCADAIIQKKITAIIDCFINSAIPPALQIDIPPEQAKKIVERRKELGPYIFREAQMSIFALLFKFWPEFCKLQSNPDSEKILVALEKKKIKEMRKKEGITAKGKEAERKLTNLAQIKSLTRLKSLTQNGSLTQPEPLIQLKPLTQVPRSVLLEELDVKRKSVISLASEDGHGRKASWTYSKYIEALEHERILIKRQEDLEKSSSSFPAGSLSMPTLKPESSVKATIPTKQKP
ncbi:regulator of G-protein signaling 22 [Turdus rufiventris]|nr:regulator of G-protein signaling 22 [Turdus rufiventris]